MRLPVPVPSPNEDARPDQKIDHLVLHYTGMQSGGAALARLCDPVAKVSAHYLVEEDGTVYALVQEERRAWHAGVSFWRGVRQLNDRSIGIEIVNPGHEWGYRPFPQRQLDAVLDLCLGILARHDVPARNVVGHSDIAPDRKQDPGELFPWRTMAAAGVGLWTQAEDAVDGQAGEAGQAAGLIADLAAIGYDTGLPEAMVIAAFQRRFLSEMVTGTVDEATARRASVVRALVDGSV